MNAISFPYFQMIHSCLQTLVMLKVYLSDTKSLKLNSCVDSGISVCTFISYFYKLINFHVIFVD